MASKVKPSPNNCVIRSLESASVVAPNRLPSAEPMMSASAESPGLTASSNSATPASCSFIPDWTNVSPPRLRKSSIPPNWLGIPSPVASSPPPMAPKRLLQISPLAAAGSAIVVSAVWVVVAPPSPKSWRNWSSCVFPLAAPPVASPPVASPVVWVPNKSAREAVTASACAVGAFSFWPSRVNA